jgi:hypothetical protein
LSTMRRILLLAALLTPSIGAVNSQTGTSVEAKDNLYQTVASLDTVLFEAVNRCDLEKLGTLVTDDLEFYHDRSDWRWANKFS